MLITLFYSFESMGEQNTVEERVHRILIDKIGILPSQITPDANMVKDLGVDSLDYAELVLEFEQTFNIKIPDQDAEQLETIADAIIYISKKMDE